MFFASYAVKKIKLNKSRAERENVEIIMIKQIAYFVQFHGHFTEDNHLYIVMDYCQVIDKLSIVLEIH